MQEIMLIIHGWSDSSKSFEGLKKALVKSGLGRVEDIYFGDYESREDNMTFHDIVDGLNDEMIKWGFIDQQGKKRCHLNVIVHSTGGLVVRHWLWRYYYRDAERLGDCPVKRIVMLAPANFGSPLAHRGKSFLGSLFKGRWKVGDLFETGKQILSGLELASAYQWSLAHHDLFIPTSYYQASQIQVTILVGIQDYQGLKGWVNKSGTDGTVVIAGTALNATKVRLDFSKPNHSGQPYLPSEWEVSQPKTDCGFAVLNHLDHGSIVQAAATLASDTNQLLLEALKIKTSQQFSSYQDKLRLLTEQTYRQTQKPMYQQFIIHAVDDQDRDIQDFHLEFNLFSKEKSRQQLVAKQQLTGKEVMYSEMIHQEMVAEMHKYTQNGSFRRLLVDTEKVNAILKQAEQDMKKPVILSLKVYVPKVDAGIHYDNQNLQNIVIYDPNDSAGNAGSLFYPNRTTLVELKINRFNQYVRISKKAFRH